MTRTFKTSLGRLRAGGRPRSLAIGISGGACSAACAILLAEYIKSLVRNPNAPPPRIVLIHVSISGDDKRENVLRNLESIVPGARGVVVTVSQGVLEGVRRVKDATDRGDLLRAAVFRTLIHATREQECDTLLLGTSADRAAADVLQSVITSRGGSSRDCSASQSVHGDVRVLRPVRDMPIRLLTRYAQIMLDGAQFAPGQVRETGIYDLVLRFVSRVGVENAASVHNVVRTADRLGAVESGGNRCFLCGAFAREFASGNGDDGTACGDCGDCGCGNGEGGGTQGLCSGCMDAVLRGEKRNAGNPVRRIINVVAEEERLRVGREDMRRQIAEFLL